MSAPAISLAPAAAAGGSLFAADGSLLEGYRLRLPPLREELGLYPGPTAQDGSPTWTLHDPGTQRFYRLGWIEFAMLAHWHLGDGTAVAAAVAARAPVTLTLQQVATFLQFLQRHHLLQPSPGAESVQRFLQEECAGRLSWPMWLLKNYLFIRIPLVRPDAWLSATLPWVGWLYSPWFTALTVLAAVLGGALVLRQWDHFAHTFLHFFSWEGAALMALALTAAKVLHELGHAWTARRYGCRVPTMGVALMVLWPVLYTDTSEAWKLAQRRARLAIAAAGLAAELTLAAWALLVWNFLPDGPARSVAFLLASATWITALTINLSPFMRFDGYYLLADLWEVPNLQDRAFTLARWWVRETLFGFGEPPPEVWPAEMRRRLLLYAIGTWFYRLVLFLGIGLLVYHLTFKLLGVFLLAVEIGWFILRPLAQELAGWYARRQRLALNRHSAVTGLVLLAGLVLVLVPWQSGIMAPALWRAERQSLLYTPVAARVVAIRVVVGQAVVAGQELLILESPDIAYDLGRVERHMDVLRGQAAFQSADRDLLDRRRIAWQEMIQAGAEAQGLRQEQARLVVRAPFAGTVVERADPLATGEWVKANEPLLLLVDRASGPHFEAYVAEHDLERLDIGRAARFIPEAPEAPVIPLQVTAIERAATRELAEPDLASIHGGTVAVRATPRSSGRAGDTVLIPETPVYRILLQATTATDAPSRMQRGWVRINGERVSLLARVGRVVLSVLLRESGF